MTRLAGARSAPGPGGGVGTMMPGETPPPPAGTAAAAGACANCGVLQQVGASPWRCSGVFALSGAAPGRWRVGSVAYRSHRSGNADSVCDKRAR